MTQPLAGVRVLELAEGVAGPYVGKMFAEFGADVIKIVPPEGDRSRRAGPFPTDEPDLEQSALFLHLNTNKRSIVGSDADVRQLIPTVDILIESAPPGTWDPEELRALQPRLVHTSVTPFGQSGPYADHKGEEIVYYAMGGPMYGTGVAEREPVKLGGDQIQYQCGTVAATATLAALQVAQASGQPVHVDVSNFETQAASIDRRMTYLLYYQYTGDVVGREERIRLGALPNGVFPTADGWAQVFTLPAWAPRMVDALGEDDLRARFEDPGWMFDEELPDLVDAALYPWFMDRTAAEAAADAQAHRWPVTPINPPRVLLDNEHFAERQFFVEVAHDTAGVVRHPGPPFRLDGAWAIKRGAPTLGANTNDVDGPHVNELEAIESHLPLEGIRVLDLTVVWAGPYCTMLLGDLGAEVIRVDNPFVFPPATRGILPRVPDELVPEFGVLGGAYPDQKCGERPWNEHGMFAVHARNKLGVTLDLRTELGKETFLRLVAVSDVLVENNSARVFDSLDLGWDVLHDRNTRLIMVRMAPLGLSGPYRDWQGFGANFEALCGLTAVRGYADNDPTARPPVFHMDPSSGAAAAFAVMLALRRRAETGVGELVEFDQAENMMQHIGELFVDAARTGRVHTPLGNRHRTRAPQGVYPCAGDDRWAVISVGDSGEWNGLRRAMGDPQWAADNRFSRAAGRREHHDEIDEHIAAWTAPRSQHEVFEQCQAEGVPAGPVLDEAGAYADPHLAARGFFRDNGSLDLKTFPFPGHPFKWDGPELKWGPIGRPGAENEYVYRDVLGLTEGEWDALVAERHITDSYLQPDGTPW